MLDIKAIKNHIDTISNVLDGDGDVLLFYDNEEKIKIGCVDANCVGIMIYSAIDESNREVTIKYYDIEEYAVKNNELKIWTRNGHVYKLKI